VKNADHVPLWNPCPRAAAVIAAVAGARQAEKPNESVNGKHEISTDQHKISTKPGLNQHKTALKSAQLLNFTGFR
jgi:hypothetical protein